MPGVRRRHGLADESACALCAAQAGGRGPDEGRDARDLGTGAVQEDATGLGAGTPKAGRHLELGSPAKAHDGLPAVQLSAAARQRRALADLRRIVANSGRSAGPADERHRVLMGRSEVDRAACGCLSGASAGPAPVARSPQSAQLPPCAGHRPPRLLSNRRLGLGLRRLPPTHPLA